MKALVTGATGFAGLHVARALLARGHRVRVLARDPDKAARLFAPGTVEIAAGDMCDAAAAAGALAGCDGVVHAAAAVSLDPREGPRLLRENVAGARCVVGGACAAGAGAIVYLSSLSAIWALPGPDPDPSRPVRDSRSAYANAKAQAEREVRALQEAGAPIAIVYPNGLIGPDDPGWSEALRAFRGFLAATLASDGGLASVDVRDLALLCARLLEERRAGRFVVGGQFQRWDALVASLEPLLGRPIRRVRAPAPLLRAAGSALDLVRRVRPLASLISREAMEYATRMRALPNDPVLHELGVSLRPLGESYRDTVAWLRAAGRLRPSDGAARG